MPVARNYKELEKMIMDKVKKELPKLTREYCHKWYGIHPELKEIVSEETFIKMVNDSFRLTIKKNEFVAEFGIFKNEEMSDEHTEKLKVLWDEFKGGYKDYVMSKFSK